VLPGLPPSAFKPPPMVDAKPPNVVKELLQHGGKAAWQITLKDASRLTGYAWGAFVGAAGFAYLLSLAIKPSGSAKRADEPAKR